MMTDVAYQEALDYLYSFVDYSRTRSDRYAPESFNLDRVRRLLSELGDPQDQYPSLHIAGTKGKGSVAAMCASTLRAAGLRTGLYTSPHLVEFTERIQIDGQPIPSQALVEHVDRLKQPAAEIPEISTYELITALGFLYFSSEQVDIAVIEVGLGGRLDATNVIAPEVSAITALSLDHTQFLGDTLAAIAAEKAGIVKSGVPLVLAPQQPEAAQVVREIAADRGAPLVEVGVDWHVEPQSHTIHAQRIRVGPAQDEQDWIELTLPLLGGHQVENAAVASAALVQLRQRGFEVPDRALKAGFAEVDWPGRFQILSENPYVIVDAAHNQHSAAQLRKTLQEYLPGRSVWLVFGASEDKNIDGMLKELAPITVRAFLAQAFHPRAAEPDELKSRAEAIGLSAEVKPRVMDALAAALRQAEADDVVLITGSLFVVGEVLARWREEGWPSLAEGTEGDGP